MGEGFADGEESGCYFDYHCASDLLVIHEVSRRPWGKLWTCGCGLFSAWTERVGRRSTDAPGERVAALAAHLRLSPARAHHPAARRSAGSVPGRVSPAHADHARGRAAGIHRVVG